MIVSPQDGPDDSPDPDSRGSHCNTPNCKTCAGTVKVLSPASISPSLLVRPGEVDVFFAGKMDRVDVSEGVVGVLDYKTTVKK